MRQRESLVGVSIAREDSLECCLVIWGPFLKSPVNYNYLSPKAKYLSKNFKDKKCET